MAYVAFITLLVFSNVKFLALRILSTYSFFKKSLNYCLFNTEFNLLSFSLPAEMGAFLTEFQLSKICI